MHFNQSELHPFKLVDRLAAYHSHFSVTQNATSSLKLMHGTKCINRPGAMAEWLWHPATNPKVGSSTPHWTSPF